MVVLIAALFLYAYRRLREWRVLVRGTAVAGAIYTGALALVVYPLARLVRRVTEKQGASGW